MLIGLQILFLLGFPLLATRLHQRYHWFSPIIASYAIGIAIGNLFPSYLNEGWSMHLTELSVLMAIPMLLFGSSMKQLVLQSKPMLLAFATACIATTIAVLVAHHVILVEDPQASLIAGMITGVYTGGTTNLNAIGFALNAPSELFVVLNAFDTVYSALYLFILLLIGKLVFSKIFKVTDWHDKSWDEELTYPFSWLDLLKTHGFAILMIGSAVGITFLLAGSLNGTWIILLLSAFAILASGLKPVQKLTQPHLYADYWLQVFAISMGSMASWEKISWEDTSILFALGLVFLVMLLIHYGLSKLFKFDRDTTIIASIAAVFGPPFIGLVAKNLKAEKLILPGIAVAIVGNAFGTYLGLAIEWMLR